MKKPVKRIEDTVPVYLQQVARTETMGDDGYGFSTIGNHKVQNYQELQSLETERFYEKFDFLTLN